MTIDRTENRVAALLGVLALSCSACWPRVTAQVPLAPPQAPAEVLRLLPGVWALHSIDGQPAQGWLILRGEDRDQTLSFALPCGWQDGTYRLEGSTVIPELTTSVVPNCDEEFLAASDTTYPELLQQRFHVSVTERQLVAQGRSRRGTGWARYARSSIDEIPRSSGGRAQR